MYIFLSIISEKVVQSTTEQVSEPVVSIAGKLTDKLDEAKEVTEDKMDTPSEKVEEKENVPVVENEATEAASSATPVHDVPYFRNLLVSETDRLNVLSEKWNEINESTTGLNDESK